MKRSLKNEFEGWTFYESTFDLETGLLVRVTEEPSRGYRHLLDNHPKRYTDPRYPGNLFGPANETQEERDKRYADFQIWKAANPSLEDRWENRGLARTTRYAPVRNKSYSPVPETIDLKITNNCNFGCSYCYQDSLPRLRHAPVKLVETLFEGLNEAPYQIALGGGEPCLHPELPAIMQYIRGKGTVPNFTTAGHVWKKSIVDATNEFGGGVAITYHPHKGIEWFTKTFKQWKESLSPRVQLNIHLMADRDGALNLNALVDSFKAEPGLSPEDINLVLLAYHPDVGRATTDRIMPKRVYMNDFPKSIMRARGEGVKVAFSEGLLPFFFSRPELGIDLTYATAMEGRFSCYVDDKGLVSLSSFVVPEKGADSIYQTRFQDIWDRPLWWGHGQPNGIACSGCKFRNQCSDQNVSSILFMCAYQDVNRFVGTQPLDKETLEDMEYFENLEGSEE